MHSCPTASAGRQVQARNPLGQPFRAVRKIGEILLKLRKVREDGIYDGLLKAVIAIKSSIYFLNFDLARARDGNPLANRLRLDRARLCINRQQSHFEKMAIL